MKHDIITRLTPCDKCGKPVGETSSWFCWKDSGELLCGECSPLKITVTPSTAESVLIPVLFEEIIG